jgi:hypothetical protein
MRRFILPLALLALSACSESEPAQGGTAGPASQTAPAAPSSTPSVPARIAVIPDRFQGIWDYVKGSCDPTSDMRTEIAERGITFYESHGAVTALTVESPQRITVELAMQGEGENWTMTRIFTLSERDSILTSTGGGAPGEPMPLKRCA